MLPRSSTQFSTTAQCIKTDLLFSWSQSVFLLSQRGLEIVDGEGSFTFNDNVLKLETFPHLVRGEWGPKDLFLLKIEFVVDR